MMIDNDNNLNNNDNDNGFTLTTKSVICGLLVKSTLNLFTKLTAISLILAPFSVKIIFQLVVLFGQNIIVNLIGLLW